MRAAWCHDGAVELRQIEYFVAVAEQLHFGRAAEALSIGQPAVSQQVARLERELGVILFDRSARTVRLTDAGTRFLPAARAVLAAVDHARSVAADSASTAPARVLRLGSSTGLGARLAGVLAALREIEPNTVTELSSAPTQARLQRVASGQLDAAFVRGVPSARGVELIEVWRDQLLVVLPADHEPARHEHVALRDLEALPLRIAPRRVNQPLVDLVLGACDAAGFTPVLGSHPGSLENLIAAIASGQPSWTVIYEAFARTLHEPRVAFRPLRPPLLMPTSLAVPVDATSRQVAPLLRACASAEVLDQDG
jgi:DNA-binding transcriptional LysR family regulator